MGLGGASTSSGIGGAAGPDNPIGYCGYAFNAETRLYTVRFRHYWPALGAWISRDPLDYVDGGNLYEYCGGMPVSFADPMGLARGKFTKETQGKLSASRSGYCDILFQRRMSGQICEDQYRRLMRENHCGDATYDPENEISDAYWQGFEDGLIEAILDPHTLLFVLSMSTGPYGLIYAGMNIALYAYEGDWLGVGLGALGAAPGAYALVAGRAAAKGVVALEANTIRFSQSSVRDTLAARAQSMKANGWQGAPIDVVRMGDGALTSADNTRLAAAGLTGTRVRGVIHAFDEPFPATRAGGNLRGATWGEAILNRIAGQRAAWRRLYPNGSPTTGVHPRTPGISM